LVEASGNITNRIFPKIFQDKMCTYLGK